MELSAISSGMVTCFSTSSAACPGNNVTTFTWMSVTSGNASIGSERKAAIPAPMNSSRMRPTNSGWWTAKKISLRSMNSQARLHIDRARRNNPLFLGESVANGKAGVVTLSQFDRCRQEAARCLFHEHRVLAAHLNHGAFRHPERRCHRALVAQASEHLRTQAAA